MICTSRLLRSGMTRCDNASRDILSYVLARLSGVARRWCYLFHTLTVAVTHRSMKHRHIILFRHARGKEVTEMRQGSAGREGWQCMVGQWLGCWDVTKLLGSRLTEPLPIQHRHVLILASQRYCSSGRAHCPLTPSSTCAKPCAPPADVFGVSGRIVPVSYQPKSCHNKIMHRGYLVYALQRSLILPSFCCTAGHTTRSCSPLLLDLMSDLSSPRLSPSRIQKKITTSLAQIIQPSVA
jgi:hypothetical protein